MYSMHWEDYNSYYGHDKLEYDLVTKEDEKVFNCVEVRGRFKSFHPNSKGKEILFDNIKLIKISSISISGLVRYQEGEIRKKKLKNK